MKMSWLFGKKKHSHKESPPDPVEEEQSSSDTGNDFIHVERPGQTTTGDGASYPTGGLYPFLSGVPTYPAPLPPNVPKDDTHMESVSYLNGIPFKLCKQLETSVNNDLDIDDLRTSEILSFIERVRNENYDYDFVLENGVITETSSTNDG